jgi:hypothetical protein
MMKKWFLDEKFPKDFIDKMEILLQKWFIAQRKFFIEKGKFKKLKP